MRLASTSFFLCALLTVLAVTSPALAQVELGSAGGVELTPPELVDPRPNIHAGTALFVSGLSTAAAGVGLQFGMGGMIGLAGGGTLMGVGSLLLFSGIPTWIVGAVRDSIAQASSSERAEVAGQWELAGVLLFCAHMALAVLGAALVGTSFGQSHYNQDQMIAGSTMLVSSFTVAMFVATPMWAEGARF